MLEKISSYVYKLLNIIPSLLCSVKDFYIIIILLVEIFRLFWFAVANRVTLLFDLETGRTIFGREPLDIIDIIVKIW